MLTTSDQLIHMDDRSVDLAHFVYMDNLGGITIGDELSARHKVFVLLDECDQLFEQDNLLFHRAEVDRTTSRLGFISQASSFDMASHMRRHWKLFSAIGELLRRQKCCGWVIEVVVGHSTFWYLSRRPLCVIWHTV